MYASNPGQQINKSPITRNLITGTKYRVKLCVRINKFQLIFSKTNDFPNFVKYK